MYKIEFYQDADREKVELFVSENGKGWITATPMWTDVLVRSFSQISNRTLIAFEKKSGKLAGVFPCYLVSSIITGKRIVSVPFATLSEPPFSGNLSVKDFFPQIQSLLESEGARSLELRRMTPFIGSEIENEFKLKDVYCFHELELSGTLEDIMMSFHASSVRRYLHKSSDLGTIIRKIDSQNDLNAFYGLYCTTRKKLHLPSLPRLFFENIYHLLSENSVFFLAENGGVPVGGIMLFFYNGRVSAEAMGWDHSHFDKYIGTFLYWTSIKWAHENGFKVFDVGRTDPENLSLMNYKKRWGMSVSELPVYLYPATEGRRGGRALKHRSYVHSLRKILFGMPMPIYKLISQFSYKHLG